MIKARHWVAGLLSSVSLAAGAANPATVLGDTFEVKVSIPNQGVIDQIAPAVAGSGTPDVEIDLPGAPADPIFALAITWEDSDTFVLKFSGFASQDLNFATVTLSDLDFRRSDNNQPVSITGVTFNETTGCAPGNCFGDFFFDPINNDTAIPRQPQYTPQVQSFTSRSATIFIEEFPQQLVSDGIALRFDVQTAVPEPGTFAMLGVGLGLMAFLRRRRAR